MDNQWISLLIFFVHKLSTERGRRVIDLLEVFFVRNTLKNKVKKMLCTGQVALNNNNKLSISNIY